MVTFVHVGTWWGVALLVVSGPARASTQGPWLALPCWVAAASTVGVVRLVDRPLGRDGVRSVEPLRGFGLAYGSAVPVAWRRLRGREPRTTAG